MPTIPTIRPVDPQAAGFRAAVDYLKRQVPAGVIKTWRTWEGEATDAAPPSTGQLNFCRVSPIAVAAEPKASQGPTKRRVYLCPMRVDFEIYTAGPLFDDLSSAWGVIESVIFPDPDVDRSAFLSIVAPHGVRDVRLLQRALPESRNDLTQAMVCGVGSIALDFYLAV